MWLIIILVFICGIAIGFIVGKKDDSINEKMTQADATKRFTHTRPEPTTKPPTILPISGICKNGIWLEPIGSHDTDPFSKQDPKPKTPRPPIEETGEYI